jgi:hypothetical protein
MRNLMMVSLIAMMGCSGAAPSDDSLPDSAEDVTKADVVYPAGTFAGDATVKAGELETVTINADKTYSSVTFIYCASQYPLDCGHASGTYKFTHGGSTRYIRFYDANGSFMKRYAWKLSGDTLKLRADGDTVCQSLTKQPDFAQEGEHCGGFIANAKQCAPGLRCQYSHVPDVGGTCVTESPCEAAGGSCVALAPGSCQGQVADATQFSCGGGLGVECCFSN